MNDRSQQAPSTTAPPAGPQASSTSQTPPADPQASSTSQTPPAGPQASSTSQTPPAGPESADPDGPSSFTRFVEEGLNRGALRWQVRGATEEQLSSWEKAGLLKISRGIGPPVARLTLKGLAHAAEMRLEEG